MNKKLLLTTSAAIASASIYSFSGLAVAATDTATVRVVQAISIADASTQLNFGDIVSTAGAETVIVTPGNVFNGGSLTPTGSPSRAVFSVDGEDGKSYAVTVPASVTLTETLVGTATMTANAFTYDGGNGVGVSGTVTNGGAPLYIGATLNVGINQASGTYNGVYNVTVAYD